nr:MAG TPA: hypothetical protein [Caudoviricetes sp.]
MEIARASILMFFLFNKIVTAQKLHLLKQN